MLETAIVHFHRFDFKSHKYRQNPWNVFTELREHGPLIKLKMPFVGTGWGVTTHESVSAVLKNDEQFVRNPKNAGRKSFIPFQWMLPRIFLTLAHNMMAADGEDHRRLRSIVDKSFARRNINDMAGQIEALANRQLDHLASQATGNGQVDLMDHFMRPFPLNAICELLGLPEEDRAQFRKWFEPMATVTNVFGMFRMGRGLRNVVRYFREQFEKVRAQPRPGLMSELVQIEAEGERLNDQELLSMAILLLIAGHETTVHLISNLVLTLFENSDAKSQLLADWSKSDAAIDETLRYTSPLQMAKPRYVANDMSFLGQDLKRGETMVPLLACANYDPQRFDAPLEFRLDRERNYHLSFGSGPHTCLGMKLAKSETHFAVKGLFERWPNMQPAFDLNRPDWSQRPATRGLKTMLVKLRT